MKRSEINAALREMEAMIREYRFALPDFCHFTPEDWNGKGHEYDEVRDNALGWAITDYGLGRFEEVGFSLITLRNGNHAMPERYPKTYAEKLLYIKEGQYSPMHFHWSKMEDIINRGGGNLVVELYNADKDEQFADTPVHFRIDGIEHTVNPGGKVILHPGQSICMEQYLYHRFYGEPGKGKVMVGEVSQCNDDTTDNRFYEQIGRFPDIEEDEQPLHLLCSDYGKFL